jgi:hypothetical protein
MAQKSRTDLKASTNGTVQWLIDLMNEIADSQTNVVDDGIGGASDGSSSVREYIARVQNSGTGTPTAVVYKNTLGFVPTYSCVSVGNYRLQHTGGFPQNKVFATANGTGEGNTFQIQIDPEDYPDNLDLYTFYKDGTQMGDADFFLHVLIFP